MGMIKDRNSKELTEADEIKKKWQEYTEELWMEVCNIVQEAMTKTIPMKKKWKKAKWLSEEASQIAKERRGAKGKGERERYTQLKAEFHRIARRDFLKAFYVNNAKKQRETIK